jgi:hypothetical protein
MKHFITNFNIEHIHIVICMYNNMGDQVYCDCTKQAILCYQLTTHIHNKGKGDAHNRPQEPKGVPSRLRPRIFLTFGTTRVVDRQPHAPAAFNPRENPWYSFLEPESTPGHMVPSVATEKFPSVTPPRIDPETVRLVAQCLNHYATQGVHNKRNEKCMSSSSSPIRNCLPIHLSQIH